MRYVKSKYSLYRQDLMYRIYIADSIYYYADNQRMTIRLTDLLFPAPVDNRTGDQIALDVIHDLGLKI